VCVYPDAFTARYLTGYPQPPLARGCSPVPHKRRTVDGNGNGCDDGRRSGPRSRLAAPNAGALLLRLYRRSVDIEKVFAAAQRRCQKVARVAVESEWELHIENFTRGSAEQEVTR
jgi:hypothetical protein